MRDDVVALYVDPRVAERFWAKVRKTDGCWLWTGSKDRKGYGKLSVGSRVDGTKRPHSAHRISWVLAYGTLNEESCVLHRCDVPACVRPDHLFIGSIADNNRDMWSKGRGHVNAFTPESRAKAYAHRSRGDAHYSRTQPHRLTRGEQHPNTHLTATDVRAIRLARADGVRLRVLAERYGVSEPTVSAIATGRNWRYIQ